MFDAFLDFFEIGQIEDLVFYFPLNTFGLEKTYGGFLLTNSQTRLAYFFPLSNYKVF